MLSRILALRKSMFAQMALLTTIFLGWGLYVFVVRPITDMPVQSTVQPPLLATETRLRSILHQFMVAERDNPDKTHAISADPFVRRIEALNPGFRFYVRVGDRAFGTGTPVLYRQFKLDQLERVHQALPDAGICSQTTQIVPQAGYDDYADFYMCKKLTYFEYHGLRRPVIPDHQDFGGISQKWLWAFSGNFLLAAGGVFAIFALIFSLHILSIRRVARLARSIDPQRLDAKLPEKGVATEILPLVRAVNNLIGEVDAAQRRATFFLSAAAHEMRTPLTVLRTRLELMEDGDQKEKLIRDVRRLTRLVNQLLTLMSIGNRRDITGFTDMVASARKVVGDLAVLAQRADVTLTFDSDVLSLEIPGDAALIESAILNLVDNAISFAPKGTAVEVHVDADGSVTVRDYGPGFGDVEPSTLFEPFARPVSSRRGYGLGLAIVNAIVRLHGGNVAAMNATEKGAVFTATFCSQAAF